jgi:predicted acetyltransferase
MNIKLLPASVDDKPLLQRLMELHQYDFSEFDGTDVDQHSMFGYAYLDHCWVENGRHPFVVRVDEQLAGFVLVNQHAHVHEIDYAVAEFFIMRKYRRYGVGRHVACAVFDRLCGTWEVRVQTNNMVTQAFWRNVIDSYTKGNYMERLAYGVGKQGLVFHLYSM